MDSANMGVRALMFLVALAFGGVTIWYSHLNRDASFERRSAISGVEEEIGWYYDLNPDCSLRGYPKILIRKAPEHGKIRTEHGFDFPAYPLNNAWSHCNTGKVPAELIYYKPDSGYVGSEKFEIVVIFPDGMTRKMYENMNVLAAT